MGKGKTIRDLEEQNEVLEYENQRLADQLARINEILNEDVQEGEDRGL